MVLMPVAPATKEAFLSMYADYCKELDTFRSESRSVDLQEVTRLYLKCPELNCRLIVLSGKKIGFVVTQYVLFENGAHAPAHFIVEFYVVPEHRRQGIGTEAVRELLRGMEGEDLFLYVLHGNAPAKAFWRSALANAGCTPIDRPELCSQDDCETMTVYVPCGTVQKGA